MSTNSVGSEYDEYNFVINKYIIKIIEDLTGEEIIGELIPKSIIDQISGRISVNVQSFGPCFCEKITYIYVDGNIAYSFRFPYIL